ncbi:MAG: DUF3169 family protein [Lachnospiraceae bacterium]|nr:DUF3169 family protein [Lachnospiraceae bacterium]
MSKKQTKTTKNVTKSFSLIMLGAGAFGAALSFITLALKDTLSGSLPSLYTSLQRLSPWIFFILSAVILIFVWGSLVRARKFCQSWNGENEEAFYMQADRYLDQPLTISTIGTIVLITWFGMVTVSVFRKNCNLYLFMLIAVLLVAELILLALFQRKTVEQVKLLNPEKKGDALSIRFQKEWIESCDEQEQLSIYRAAYKAFSALPLVSGVLFILLILLLPYSGYSFLPFFCTGLTWLVPTIVYFHEAARQKK